MISLVGDGDAVDDVDDVDSESRAFRMSITP